MLFCVLPLPLCFFRYPSAEILEAGAAAGLEPYERGVIGRPLRQPPLPQIVLVVEAKLLQAALGHPRQFHLHLLGRGRVHTPIKG